MLARCLSTLRGARRTRRRPSPICSTRRHPAGEAHAIDRNDARIDIASALQQLTPRQRLFCTLLGEEGLSIKDGCGAAPNPARHALRGYQAHQKGLCRSRPWRLSRELTRHFWKGFRIADLGPKSAWIR